MNRKQGLKHGKKSEVTGANIAPTKPALYFSRAGAPGVDSSWVWAFIKSEVSKYPSRDASRLRQSPATDKGL